jgi:hypothetical protein
MTEHNLTRRAFFAGASATVSSAALAIAIVPAVAAPATRTTVEYEDLTRYYAFLWCEFQRLSEELGVRQHDSTTAHRNGDVDAIEGALTDAPSTRAMRVLQLLDADRDSLTSEGMCHLSSRPSREERAIGQLQTATQMIRSAMSDLGSRSYMVAVREESSGVAAALKFNTNGTLAERIELA